jgi:hypothetical protein
MHSYNAFGTLGLTISSSARGNTTLESAVTLTKRLRWDIQALGIRLAKAATAEEASRRKNNKAKSRAGHEQEIREIVQDIRRLLTLIEDAIPLITLSIQTSGASFSTTLPPSVSPSRMLQASTFLTAGDTQYSMNPSTSVQVGPTFTLSLYMLFAGHHRTNDDENTARDATWKEVIHKGRVRLMRIPLQTTHQQNSKLSIRQGFSNNNSGEPILKSIEFGEEEAPTITGERKQHEYSYHLEIIEDLEDDRVHTFEDGELQPGPYGGVQLAGIRDFLPIYQVSKIFYADTGKILSIGNHGELNSPVLLLKRDINALPPRRMMQENEKSNCLYEDPKEHVATEAEDDSQEDIDKQLRRESSVPVLEEPVPDAQASDYKAWRLPADLDSEWLALEVYTETEDSSSEDEQDVNDDSAYMSHLPSSSRAAQYDNSLVSDLAHLNINHESSPSLAPSRQAPSPPPFSGFSSPKFQPYGQVRSSLSLLEMLIRLTALQQFQQASHLSIPDELLTFFLEESSTTGAGGDGEQRRRTRQEARQKVGFDPYDESPVKRRGEDYQYQNQDQEEYEGYSRGGTPHDNHDQRNGYPSPQQRWSPEQNLSPRGTPSPEPWLLRSRENSPASLLKLPAFRPSSPMSPYRPRRKATRPLERVQQVSRAVNGSPLGRGMSVETDSSLGTSPGSPTLVDRVERGEKG